MRPVLPVGYALLWPTRPFPTSVPCLGDDAPRGVGCMGAQAIPNPETARQAHDPSKGFPEADRSPCGGGCGPVLCPQIGIPQYRVPPLPIVNLIAATTTATGLRVRAEIDKGEYPQGREIADEEMAQVRLRPHRFHGDWNYTIRPRCS